MIKTLKEMGVGKMTISDHILHEVFTFVDHLTDLNGKVQLLYF
jgi:hypothetical protein